MSDETDYGVGGHRYNDDLLLDPDQRERARREYSSVFHLLDHELLRVSFKRRNDSANRAKRQAHVAGFWAVVAAFLSLSGAASEPLWGHLNAPWPKVIAIVSATLGLLALIVSAAGLIYGKRKDVWLYERFYAERLRQFHFQSFIWRLPEIAESLKNARAREKYQTNRDDWFRNLDSNLEGARDSQMAALLKSPTPSDTWLHPDGKHGNEPQLPSSVSLDPVFAAYWTFRFKEQEGYANHMVRLRNQPTEKGGKAPRKSWLWYPGINQPLKSKVKILNNLWIATLALLVVTHVAVLISHIGGWHIPGEKWLHLAIVLAALLAVAIKTLSEGLDLAPELQRYEEYEAVVTRLMQAFEVAEPRQKLRLMIELEKAAYDEMREFLRGHSEAAFIM